MRDVAESDEVISVKDAHENNNHRIGDAWAAVIWSLAVEPEPKESECLHANIPNCRIYTQSAEPLSGVPAVTVIYIYDEKKIDIKAVMFNEAPSQVIREKQQSAQEVH